MLRKALFTAAFALGMALTASQALAAYAVTDLNMRTGPGTRHARIAVIPGGAYVDILGCWSGWCRVNFRGYVGWASARYLAEGRLRPRIYYPPRVYYPPRIYIRPGIGFGIHPYPRRGWYHWHPWP